MGDGHSRRLGVLAKYLVDAVGQPNPVGWPYVGAAYVHVLLHAEVGERQDLWDPVQQLLNRVVFIVVAIVNVIGAVGAYEGNAAAGADHINSGLAVTGHPIPPDLV